MNTDFLARDLSPRDQADGLRRLFSAAQTRFIAVAANPDVAFAGLALERLASACADVDPERKVLVVDAVRGTPDEMAALDLSACIERLDDRLCYLAARGLPMRHVDARGSCDGFLQALADAAPEAGTIVVHAEPGELGRLFSQRAPRPVLLAADHPASVTAAYANMKLLAQRFGLMAFDLLLVAAANSPRTPRIAEQLALTADRFAGAALHDWAAIDPAAAGAAPRALLRLARGLIGPGAHSAVPSRPAPPSQVAR
jgi:flagellar biosynthesis protein FlhG